MAELSWVKDILLGISSSLKKKNGSNVSNLLGGLIGLVWFYGISTFIGYLMPNLVYTY